MPPPHSRMCWSMRCPSLRDEPLARCPRSGRCPSAMVGAALGASRRRARPAGHPWSTAPPERVDLADAGPRVRWRASTVDQVDRGAGTRRARPAIAAARSPACRRRAVGQVGYREEAPARADQRPHADPGVLVLAQLLDLAVARAHRLVAAVHHPRVGIPAPAASAASTAALATSKWVMTGPYRPGTTCPANQPAFHPSAGLRWPQPAAGSACTVLAGVTAGAATPAGGSHPASPMRRCAPHSSLSLPLRPSAGRAVGDSHPTPPKLPSVARPALRAADSYACALHPGGSFLPCPPSRATSLDHAAPMNIAADSTRTLPSVLR